MNNDLTRPYFFWSSFLHIFKLNEEWENPHIQAQARISLICTMGYPLDISMKITLKPKFFPPQGILIRLFDMVQSKTENVTNIWCLEF